MSKLKIYKKNKKSVTVLFLSFFMLFLTQVHGQFSLNGTAFQLDENCYQMTPDVLTSIASIWQEDQIDLSNSFDFKFNLNLGCADAGADGMVFVLHPTINVLGQSGGDIGYGGNFIPSLGVEFDTFRNGDLADLDADHIAILRDGNVNHANPNNLAGPVNAATTDDVEDCVYHPVRITWDATGLLLEVYFDCELRLSYTGDIVNDIFGGNPVVFWGLVASTGGVSNVQSVCFDSSESVTSETSQTLSVCEGEELIIEASQPSANYSWSPTTGLSDPNLPNPTVFPTENITYIGMGSDACDNEFVDTFNIIVNSTVIDYEIQPSFTDTVLCAGETIDLMLQTDSNNEILWQDGTTESSYFIDESGSYEVVISNDCSSPITINLEVTLLTDCMVSMPNAFTPDGDGVNDLFAPVSQLTIEIFQFKIYNRWGNLVFDETTTQGWDGTADGKAATSDVYVYVIEYSTDNGEKEILSGDVTLIR